MSESARDRDHLGRPRNARSRDALGRPLPDGSPGEGIPYADASAEREQLADLELSDPVSLLDGAQRLLDSGRPFEAHELLEAAWKRAPAAERDLWRALAQLAVAVTHSLRGNAVGASALFVRAAEVLAVQQTPAPYGINVRSLAARARQLASGDERPADANMKLQLRRQNSAP